MAGDFQYWCDLLDNVAERANDNLITMFQRANHAASSGEVASGALVAIASQLAYGNALAAADFFMRHTEGGDS